MDIGKNVQRLAKYIGKIFKTPPHDLTGADMVQMTADSIESDLVDVPLVAMP